MGLQQTKKLLHSEGNNQQIDKAVNWMGEDICKPHIWQGVNIQNIHRTQTTQFKHGQRIWMDVFPKKDIKMPNKHTKKAEMKT